MYGNPDWDPLESARERLAGGPAPGPPTRFVNLNGGLGGLAPPHLYNQVIGDSLNQQNSKKRLFPNLSLRSYFPPRSARCSPLAPFAALRFGLLHTTDFPRLKPLRVPKAASRRAPQLASLAAPRSGLFRSAITRAINWKEALDH